MHNPNQVIAQMDQLQSICNKHSESNRIGHFNEIVGTVQARIRHAKEDYYSDFLVMVIGAFSAGKSTLINSLVKQKVCKVGIQPTTDDISILKFPNVPGVLLMDSPGVDALGQEGHTKKALEAAQRANMAIVVLNVRQLLRESERPLLRELLLSKSHVLVALNY